MNALDMPGFAEAVLEERLARDLAFLELPETVAGYELRPLRLIDYLALQRDRSPLLLDADRNVRAPTAAELATFLWFMSIEHGDYEPGAAVDVAGRREFLRGCRAFQPPGLPLLRTRRAMGRWTARWDRALNRMGEVLVAARAYVSRALQDRPAAKAGAAFTPSYYSEGVFWCALLARQYGWSEGAVLRLPVRRLFQYLNEIKEQSGSKRAGLVNPSARVAAAFLQKINAELPIGGGNPKSEVRSSRS